MLGLLCAVMKKAASYILPDTHEVDCDAAAIRNARVELAAAYR